MRPKYSGEDEEEKNKASDPKADRLTVVPHSLQVLCLALSPPIPCCSASLLLLGKGTVHWFVSEGQEMKEKRRQVNPC